MSPATHEIAIPLGHLHVRQFGTQGPWLLLAHGFPLDHTMWHGQYQALADRCRLIVPDLRGFGASSVTAGTVTMESLADDLLLLMDHLAPQQPFLFCGLSMGGYIGWQLWRKAAPRLRGLVQCDTRAAADSVEVARGRAMMAAQVSTTGLQGVAEGMLPKLFADATFQHQPAVVAATRTVIESASPEGVAAAQRGMARRPDVTSWLGKITTPTLLICGAEDSISPPREMQAIADAMPHARLTIIPEAGHMSPLEQPQPVNAAIAAFIGECEPHSPSRDPARPRDT